MMKTIQIHQFVHDLPTTKAELTKKSGKPSRPPRGERIGVMVARVVDDQHYAVQMSLVSSGRSIKGGFIADADVFDPHIAVNLALGKIMTGENLPRVCISPATTHRSKNIQAQFDSFLLQASKVFKDKSRRTSLPA
jgi:hypothetical protein